MLKACLLRVFILYINKFKLEIVFLNNFYILNILVVIKQISFFTGLILNQKQKELSFMIKVFLKKKTSINNYWYHFLPYK